MHIHDQLKGFPTGSAGKESPCNMWDLGSIPGVGRSPGEGKGYPLQDSGLENSTNCTVQGLQSVGHNWVTFTFLLSFDQLKVVNLKFISLCFPHTASNPGSKLTSLTKLMLINCHSSVTINWVIDLHSSQEDVGSYNMLFFSIYMIRIHGH